MAQQKSIKKNFLMNAILTMSSLVFPLITFPYVSRVLGPAGTGAVSFANSFVMYFLMISQLGIPTYGIRACAQVREDKIELSRTVQELVIINLVMSAVMYVLLFLSLATIPRLQSDKTLYLVVSSMILLNAVGMEWMYKGLEEYTYITIRSVIFKALALVFMFLLIHEKEDYVIYGGIAVFAAYASNLVNLVYARKYITMRPVGNYNFRRHFKAVGIFFAMAVATTIYTNLDVVMLGFMTTKVDTGYYDAAVKIKNILVSIVTSLGAVLLPRSSYYVEQGMMDQFREVSRKAIRFVFLFAFPLTLYFILFASEGIFFLSGQQYGGSIRPMQIIMPTLVFIGLSNILGLQILVPTGKEKTVLYSEIAGAVTDLVLNALLIPRFHASGAAMGTVMAELVVLIWQYVALKDEVSSMFQSVPVLPIVTALLAAAAVSLWVKLLGLGFFVTLLISACLFFAGYLAVLLIWKEPFTTDLLRQVKNRLMLG